MSRGQAHTLEAFSAGLVLLGAIVFALQATAVTPLTASTASQHIENQQSEVAQGLLDAAAANGTLKQSVLFVNNSTGCYHGSVSCPTHAYVDGGPPLPFGTSLNETFREEGVAFNVNVIYVDNSSTGERVLAKRQVVNFGRPSDNAVTARRTVTLYDDDELHDASGVPNGTTLENSTYYVPNLDDGGRVYNVVQVEVVVWRM